MRSSCKSAAHPR